MDMVVFDSRVSPEDDEAEGAVVSAAGCAAPGALSAGGVADGV